MMRRLPLYVGLAVAVWALWLTAARLGNHHPVARQEAADPAAGLGAGASAGASTPVPEMAAEDVNVSPSAAPRGRLPDADEMPWPAATPANPAPFAALHQALADALAQNEWSRVKDLVDALATQAERQEALRWLAHHENEAGLAMALTILWMMPADDPRHAEGLRALQGIRDPALAAWLVQALAAAPDERTRARLADVWAAVRGPALIQAIADQLSASATPAQRAPWLTALRQRADYEELASLMELAATREPDVAEAAAYGLANIGGWEACLWLAESALQPNAPRYYQEALATSSSGFSQAALAFIAGGQYVPEPLRVAARAGGVAAGDARAAAGQGIAPVPPALAPDRVAAAQPEQDGVDDGERWF